MKLNFQGLKSISTNIIVNITISGLIILYGQRLLAVWSLWRCFARPSPQPLSVATNLWASVLSPETEKLLYYVTDLAIEQCSISLPADIPNNFDSLKTEIIRIKWQKKPFTLKLKICTLIMY